jgi:SAM-dependent methyltransferase
MNKKLSEIYKAIAKFPTVESIGLGDPEKVGSSIFNFVNKHVKINTDMRILDLGCGLGRSSAPFVDFLSNGKGHLVGVDVIERMVKFCREVIGSRYGNVSFYTCAAADSYLKEKQMENSSSPQPIEEILKQHKPFDLVNAFSVFTHLLPEEMQNYFYLFDRILTPNGRLVLTFLFLDEWTRPKIRTRALPTMILPDTPKKMGEIGNICFASPSNPRAVVAISIENVLSMVKVSGFQPEQIPTRADSLWFLEGYSIKNVPRCLDPPT